jgi:carboxylesterase type B
MWLRNFVKRNRFYLDIFYGYVTIYLLKLCFPGMEREINLEIKYSKDGTQMKQIDTTSGSLTGLRTEYGYRFLGVPFATAKRFQKPEESRWEGVRECTSYGKKAFQDNESLENCGEDCLHLNIYTPDLYGSYPVVIDIHGGGFQGGSNSGPAAHPWHFLDEQRCVYVPIQYRLGVWGYLYLGEELGTEYACSGNCGTLDQLAAIRWVVKNISLFGGDPNRITLMGSSAGAKSIGALLAVPESKGLFQQIISSSGGPQCIRTKKTAGCVTNMLLNALACTAKDLLTLSDEELLRGQKVITDNLGNTCMFGPVADNIVIGENWAEFLQSEEAWSGKALIGTNRRECGSMAQDMPDFLEKTAQIASDLFGTNAVYAHQAYETLTKGKELSVEEQKETWVRVISDFMYRSYSDRWAMRFSKRGMQVWQYSMEWLPAHHDTDRRFVWHELAGDFDGLIPPEKWRRAGQLSDAMYEAFLSFILYGNPNCRPLPYLEPLSENRRVKWMFDEVVQVKTWENGKEDTLEGFPESVYSQERGRE